MPGESDGPCLICGKDLIGRLVPLPDGSARIHADCFTCCVDGMPILNGYYEENGELFCEDHYVQFFCEPCGGCGQRIRSQESIEAMGCSWHVDCFVCARCSQPLSEPAEGTDGTDATKFNFYFFNGAIYCAKDYLEHMADKCSGCGFNVVDSALEVLGHTWHPECFVCSECKEPLIHMSDPTFYVYNGQPLCARDREALMGLYESERAQLQSAPMPSPKKFEPYNAPMASERGACISRGIGKDLDCTGRSAASTNMISDASFKSHRQHDFPRNSDC